MQIQLFKMVRTQGNRGRGASSQGFPTPMLPPPSPELALILRSLEAINETLKGRQPADVEVEPTPSGVGKPKASRDLRGREQFCLRTLTGAQLLLGILGSGPGNRKDSWS
jgi:hypothetical protein